MITWIVTHVMPLTHERHTPLLDVHPLQPGHSEIFATPAGWRDYTETHPHHTVVGNLKIHESLWSPQLQNRRDILVLLPSGYGSGTRRYPVIYMHDGQNLFDQQTSYAGEWYVDETMQTLSQEGIDAIIVGIPNMGVDRLAEYSPFVDARGSGGKGDRYLAFLAETLKPLIDRDFRTLPAREHTGIVGSSMGGLISLYGFFRYSDYFGFAGVMSPSLWFAGRAIFQSIRRESFRTGKLYLDMGGQEGPPARGSRIGQHVTNRYLRDAHEMAQLLEQQGYRAGRALMYVEALEATHSEAAWAHRLPHALRFLLQP
jgi:predicted alpha/beta superfamily hydrolase